MRLTLSALLRPGVSPRSALDGERSQAGIVFSAVLFLLLSAALPLIGEAVPNVLISEFLSHNGGGLRDSDGDTPGWIELHNTSTNDISIGGWHLTDSPTNLTRWTFPETSIPAGGYLVVMASGKDRAAAGAELHTNFQLEDNGEYLALVKPDGRTIAHAFSPSYPPQRSNVSYGIEDAGSGTPYLSVDFNDDDSGETGAANTEAGFRTMTLSANPSTFDGVTVQISPLGGSTLDDRDRTAPTPSASITEDQLYDDYIYATGTSNGSGLRVALSGLPANQSFQLKIWSFDPGGSTVGSRISQWIETASGVTNVLAEAYSFDISVPINADGDHTFTAWVRTSPAGQLTIEARRTGGVSTTVYINALQLIMPAATNVQSMEERYFAQPTPGAPNGSGSLGLVADTHFSADRGFYSEPFDVAISTATPEARVYYTTNGGTPAPGNGTLYSGPVHISTTTILRAAAFRDGYVSSDVDTQTYLFINSVLHQPGTQPGYPTTWQASYPADYGVDQWVVSHPKYGLTISNDMRSVPSLSVVTDHDGLWGPANGIYNHSTTVGWERAASVELIDGDGSSRFGVNCGVEMQGNASRDNVRTPKHSMRLSFKGQYGPTKLNYGWFPGTVKEFDTIVLRALGFCDAWPSRYSDTSVIPGTTMIGLRYRPETAIYLRDVWMKDSYREMGHLASRSTFVHLYLNGLYWGLYNPSERLDADFFSAHLGGRSWDWDVMAGDDTYDFAEVRDGTKDDWNQLMNLVNAGVTSDAAYQAVAELVDIENLCDYMLLHFYAEAEDWPFHNWYAAHRRATNGAPATKWIFTVWDQEIGLDRLIRRDRVNVSNADTPARIYSQLRAYPEFRQLFADRAQKHLLNGGALTPERSIARMKARASVIEHALAGESARWGDARKYTIGANPGTGKTFTPDEWWRPELEQLYTNFFPSLSSIALGRLRSNGLFPSIDAPSFNQWGGAVPAGFELGMTNSNGTGTVFYTIDGSDPRVYGSGGVSPNAQAYDGMIPINAVTVVRARVYSGGEWSALAEAAFYPPQDLSRLRISELMYNPPAVGLTNGEEFEFVELKNAGTNTLNLSGLRFTQGITFAFTNGFVLEPNGFCVLVRNPAAFAAKHPGVAVAGVYAGRLDNNGETLALAFPDGSPVLSIQYKDSVAWPACADGFGFSLVPRTPRTRSLDDGGAWRASALPGGSPGAEDPEPAIPGILINELLTHTDPPQQDTIELYNPTGSAADIGGWFLSDDRAEPLKFRIPDGTSIPANGYVTFDASSFNPAEVTSRNFSLSSTGERVYLFSALPNGQLTGYSYGAEFGAAFNGVAFARYTNGVNEDCFAQETTNTLGGPNTPPRISPVVISEINYNPAQGDDEFIELANRTKETVRLFDSTYFTNAWKIGGIGFTLPPGLEIPPGGLVLVVSTNPAAFRTKYSVPAEVPVIGPFPGTLQNSGEQLSLEAPDTPNTNGVVPYVVVDQVRYNDKSPWPPLADGTGASLQRVDLGAYANSAMNWVAANPTPGQLSGAADSDHDGLPDDWERLHNTQVLVPDSDADPDGDGMNNLQEYLAGTDPQSGESALRLEANNGSEGQVSLRFTAVSGHTYTVLRSGPGEGSWTAVLEVEPANTNRVIEFQEDTTIYESRWYKLSTPTAASAR